MKKNFLLALSAIFVLTIVSCSNKGGKTGLLVPKNALFVMHINMPSLSAKLTWDEIKSTNWFKEMGRDDKQDSLSRQLLENPESSGIDMTKNHVMFVSKEGQAGYFAFVGALKEAAAFEATVTKMNHGKLKISTEGEYKVAIDENDKTAIILWAKEHFLVVANAPLNRLSYTGDYKEVEKLSVDALKQIGKNIHSLKGEDLLDNDKRFAELIKEEGDLHFWGNSRELSGSSMEGFGSMMKMDVLLDNNVGGATLNFDNGKISVKAKQYFGKEMTDQLDKYPAKAVGADVINRLPQGNVLAAGVFNFPPEGIKPFLKLTATDGVVNGYMGQIKYSVDEFVKANKGDIAFAITNFEMTKDSVEYDGYDGKKEYMIMPRPKVGFVAGVSVNDKDAFNKLVGIVAAETGKSGMPKVDYKIENNWFAVGDNEAVVNSFLAGSSKPAYADKLSGHGAGFYLDLQQLMQVGRRSMPSGREDGFTDSSFNISANFWKDVVMYGDFKNGTIVSQIEINLVDKNTNSLKQLNKYIDQIYNARPKRDYGSWEDAPVKADTTTLRVQ